MKNEELGVKQINSVLGRVNATWDVRGGWVLV